MDLKPGDLVLVKADAFKGKRKIRHRWEDEAWEVVCQITTDVPSYKVTDQHGQSCILHQNWLLLITSEVGIPLCMGICHAWTDVPAPPHASQLSREVKVGWCHKRIVVVLTQCPASKTSLRWINGKLQLLLWMTTRASTDDG